MCDPVRVPEQVLPRVRAAVLGAVGLPLAGVVAVLLAAAWAGRLAPDSVVDPGTVVRVASPVVTVLGELAVAVTLGALALTAFALPRGTGRTRSDGEAARRAPVVASGAAGAWTVLAVAELVLTYATVTGRSPASPTFGNELATFATQISLGRILLLTVVVAAVSCLLAMLVTGPRGALVTGLLVLVALAARSQTGHASGSTSHELAISSMFLHLTGAALWIGGLAALALLVRRLGRDLPVAVARYSPVAAWCLVAVGTSGVINAAIRVGGVDGLGTRYGGLVVAKVLLLGALGLVGLWHRRAVVRRLADDGAGERLGLFWRLAAVELAVMGAVSGVAVALGASPPPQPLEPTGELTPAQLVTGHVLPPPPTFENWFTVFRWDALAALGCLAAVVVYVRWALRLRARGDHWPLGRTVSFVVGVLVLAWTTSGGAATYGHVLFSAHMVQHMTIVMVVPIFLVLGAPVTLAVRALPVRTDGSRGPREWLLGLVHSRWAALWGHPVVAAANFAGSMFVFYYSDLFELALTTYVGHLAMVAHFTLAGYLFVNALVGVDPGPPRPAYPIRLVVLFATMAVHAFFGVALVDGQTLLVADWFGNLGRPWGPPALEDQQRGGAIAWGISELPMLAIAVVLAVSWTRDDERAARRRDRQADRDGDAELAAYNEMLARLGTQEPRDP